MQNVNEAPTFIHQFDQDEQIISTKDLSVFTVGVFKSFLELVCNLKKTITALIGGSGSGKSTFYVALIE